MKDSLGSTLVLSGSGHGAVLDPEGPEAAIFNELEVVEVAVVVWGDFDVLIPPDRVFQSVRVNEKI